MDAKLKALKVVDLKDLLSKAGEQIPAKANKPDLIAKILASSSAQSKYNELYGGGTLVPAPAAPVSTSVVQPQTATPAVKASAPVPVPTPAASTPAAEKPSTNSQLTPSTAQSTPTPSNEDEETAKRRARAERFGVAFKEVPETERKKTKAGGTVANGAVKRKASVTDDTEKLKTRAARFGLDTSKTNAGSKRTAPAEEVDPEEAERRRKRAERFGINA